MATDERTSGPMPLEARLSDVETIRSINERFDRGRARMARMEAELQGMRTDLRANTSLTAEQNEMTAEMHEVWMTAKGGIATVAKFGRGLGKTGLWLRKAVMWVAPPVAAVVAAYHALKAWLHWGA